MMNSHHIQQHFFRAITFCFFLFTFFLSTASNLVAQDLTSSTPLGTAPGAPAGSYGLSAFDNLNLFNGSLNFNLPLVQMSGRGGTQVPLMLPIEQKWVVRRWIVDPLNPNNYITFADPNWWNDLPSLPRYGLGSMYARNSGEGATTGCPDGSGNAYFTSTLTRLTFVAPDGTEYELRDQLTNGHWLTVSPGCPSSPYGANRGKVFVTSDGSAATFISDVDILDGNIASSSISVVSGYLLLRDGTRYRIDNGDITWMRDRNGNKVSFNNDHQNGISTITDSLNRKITIEFAVNDGAPYGLCDRITLKGFNGAERTIRISKKSLQEVLRSGYTLQTEEQLFPELDGSPTDYDTEKVSAVWLPNGRSYNFLYDSYGELARVELPTGGAIEYDWAAGLENGAASGVIMPSGDVPAIFRRVVQRRTYREGNVLESRQTFSRPESAISSSPYLQNLGYVTVNQYDGAVSPKLLTSSKHYFHGSAALSLFQDGLSYPAWKDGREYKTDLFAVTDNSGSTALKKTLTSTFAQRAPVSWWVGDADTAPPNDPRLIETMTTLADTNQVTKQSAINPTDPTIIGFDQYNNQTDIWEYDYGQGSPGALLRHTHTNYLTTLNSSAYDTVNPGTSNPNPALTMHLRDLPTQISVYDAGGTERSRVTMEYDNYAGGGGNHALLVLRSGISGLCDGTSQTCPGPNGAHGPNFTDQNHITRGNVTATTGYLITNGSVPDCIATPTQCVKSYAQFDVAGNIVKVIDARGNSTSASYDDYFGPPNGNAHLNSAPIELSGKTSYGFPTSVTNAKGQTTFTKFDYYLGKPVDGEDANGVVASGDYNDALDRPKQIRRALGTSSASQTSFDYDDTNRIVTVTSDQNSFNDNVLKSQTVYDGLGRAIESRQYETSTQYVALKQTPFIALQDPDTSVWVGASQYSNPYRPHLGEQPIWTTSFADALGRITKVRTPDNAVIRTSYSGNSVTITDQAGKARKSVSDALGQLRQVYEDPTAGGLNYLTSYEYDVLGDLTTVTQQDPVTQYTQTRTFVYDSLKRLTAATNPDSGSYNYQYDKGGNLLVKSHNLRGVHTHYEYDELNRIVRRWYNSSNLLTATTNNSPALPSTVGSSDEVKYFYDAQNPPGAPTFDRGYATGRLIAVTYGGSSSGNYYGYDALGKPKLTLQQTGGINYQTTAVYNLAGMMTTETYPSGNTVSYAYDTAGRTNSLTGNLGGTERSYATEISYSPLGGMTKEKFGTDTAIYNKLFYNSRGQLAEIREGVNPNDTGHEYGAIINYYGTCWGMCGGPNSTTPMTDNNGNLKKQEVFVPGSNSWLQHYEYDNLNRLVSVNETTGNSDHDWRQEYDYDRFGNRTIDQAHTSGPSVGPLIPKPNFQVETSTNRLFAPGDLALLEHQRLMQYDAAGSLKKDSHTGAGERIYDAENRMVSAATAGVSPALYSYDADGQRVRRNVDGVETWQVYGFDGELLAEYAAGSPNTSPQKEYGYRNGQLLITAEPPALVNTALATSGATASASSTYGTQGAANVINGDRKGLNSSWWVDNTSFDYPDSIEVTFPSARTINEIDVFGLQQNPSSPVEPTLTLTSSYALSNFEVQYSTGTTWATVTGGIVTGNDKVWRKFSFDPLTTDKIQIKITDVAGDNHSQVVELEAWGPPPVNAALSANGATSSASSTHPSFVTTSVNDGERKGLNMGWWTDNTSDNHADWIQVDFAGTRTITEIDVVGLQEPWSSPVEPTLELTARYALSIFEVLYWTGSAWATVPGGNVSGNDKVWRRFTFAPITTSKIRVYVSNVAGDNYSQVVELEAWGPPVDAGSTAKLNWLVTDHLGTPRMVFDQTGSLANVKRHDYLPFGEELVAGQGLRTIGKGYVPDTVRQKFTSYERDGETGLDYAQARYYANKQGRFTSPDPLLASAQTGDPQTWNRYSYTLNNPLKYFDSTGMDEEYTPEYRPCEIGVDAGCSKTRTVLGGVTVSSPINDTEIVSNLQIMTGLENPLPMRGTAATLLDHIADGTGGEALAGTVAVGTLKSGGTGAVVVGGVATAGLFGAVVYDLARAIGKAITDAIPRSLPFDPTNQITLFRGLNGTNPGAFRVDPDGVSVFEAPPPGYTYALPINATYRGPKVPGTIANVTNPALLGGIAIYTPHLGGPLHWSLNFPGRTPEEIKNTLSGFAKSVLK